jgi:hypothetical protein
VPLTTRKQEAQWIAQPVNDDMDLGAESTTTPA